MFTPLIFLRNFTGLGTPEMLSGPALPACPPKLKRRWELARAKGGELKNKAWENEGKADFLQRLNRKRR